MVPPYPVLISQLLQDPKKNAPLKNEEEIYKRLNIWYITRVSFCQIQLRFTVWAQYKIPSVLLIVVWHQSNHFWQIIFQNTFNMHEVLVILKKYNRIGICFCYSISTVCMRLVTLWTVCWLWICIMCFCVLHVAPLVLNLLAACFLLMLVFWCLLCCVPICNIIFLSIILSVIMLSFLRYVCFSPLPERPSPLFRAYCNSLWYSMIDLCEYYHPFTLFI